MRVLFDAFWWSKGPPSGRMVVREVIGAWLREFSDDQVAVAIPARDLAQARREMPSQAWLLPLRMRPQALAATVELGLLARRIGADVCLAQNYTPLVGPAAVFLHDVLFQTNPEWFTRVERIMFWPMPRLARRAAAVFTSSANEAARIRRENPALDPVPVGLGLPAGLVGGAAIKPDTVGADDRFILSAGRLNARKNLRRLIAAARRAESVTPSCPLLVVGERQGLSGVDSEEIALAVDEGVVRFLGSVSDGELHWLYQHAELFTFVSLDEGYGLPPVEALANGCPVLVSDIPIMHETLGDHATFTDPLSVDGIADALDRRSTTRATAATAQADSLDFTPGTWSSVVSAMRSSLIKVLPSSR